MMFDEYLYTDAWQAKANDKEKPRITYVIAKKERIGSKHLNFHYILEFTSNFILNFPL